MRDEIFIEKITRSRQPGHCVLILSSGENILAIIDDILKLSLNKGNKISSKEIEIIQNSLKLSRLKNYAIKISAGYIRSEKQIIEKLKKKGYEQKQYADVITHLKNNGIIDDERFCENFLRYAVNKKWGKNKTIQELKIRGISENIYQIIINDFYDNTDNFANALNLAEKKLRLIEKKPLDKKKDAVFRHLLTKGFDYDTIKKVLNKIFKH